MTDQIDFSSLFWRNLPIALRRSDNDESLQELNVRVLSGSARGSQTLKASRHPLPPHLDLC